MHEMPKISAFSYLKEVDIVGEPIEQPRGP